MPCFFLRVAFYGTEAVLFHLFEIVCYLKVVKQAHLQGSVTMSCSGKKNCEVCHSKGKSDSSSVSGVVSSATLYYLGKISTRKLL